MLRTRNMGTAAAIALLIGLSGLSVAGPPRQMEKFDRGVVAVSTPEGKVHFGWRLLGDDPEDGDRRGFPDPFVLV